MLNAFGWQEMLLIILLLMIVLVPLAIILAVVYFIVRARTPASVPSNGVATQSPSSRFALRSLALIGGVAVLVIVGTLIFMFVAHVKHGS